MLTCVGATDSSDNKTSWSSYGIGTDVTAPGDNVFTTFSGGGFGGASGTSFSAPVTLGVYALMMAANPALAPADLDRILFATARDLGAAGRDNLYGWGRINAAAAVITARSEGAPSPDIVAPSVRFEAPASGVTVSGTYVVRVTASDDRAVAGIELWINGRMAATSTSASLSYDWDTCPTNTRGRKRAACGGTSSLKVTAKDAAGNASSATVFVSVVQ
jgi:subtilisin family serine protease